MAYDPYYSYDALLLKFDGDNNSRDFSEEVGNGVTPYGDAKISTAQSKFGGSSGYFDGNGDCLIFPYTSNFNFANGTRRLYD